MKVKRTSLWNKACEELRKHQEFISKVQQNPEFLKEPFGDPFSGEDLKAQLGGGEDSEDSDSDDDPMNNQEDLGMSSPVMRGRNQQQQPHSLPFYSDGEEDDTDSDDVNTKAKSHKHDLKKQKLQKSSSLNSSESQLHSVANGGSLSQKSSPLALATKTVPSSIHSSTPLIPLISPRNSESTNDKKEGTKDKKMSKKKQKELHQQQQLLLDEANANISGTSPIDEEKGDDTINGSSIKKKRGRPKKNKPEEVLELGKNKFSGNSPSTSSQQSMVSSQVSYYTEYSNRNK